jgi:hypothetical protein
MSGGFEVVMSDLQDAAATFRSEGQTFEAIMPMACPALPDGGSAGFNGSLNALVEAVTLLHLQVGGDIEDNGSKLQTAHDNYQHTEESLTALLQQIGSPGAVR